MKPTFLVVGAARSGTTGLVEGLRAHPRVFVTEPKEPNYFALHGQPAAFTGPGDAATINRVSVTERESYLGLYPRDGDYLALGDASVSTLYYHRRALPEIRAMNPDMRLVVLLREPVERAHSAHQYMLARGREPEEDFLTALAAEDERRRAGWHHIWHYAAMSHYADAISALYKTFGTEQVGVWFYDDLNADYVATAGGVLDFVGAPAEAADLANVPRVNVSGKPRLAPVHAVVGWTTRQEPLRRAVKRATSYRFRERVRRAVLTRSAIPPQVRVELAPRFADDLTRLRALVPGPHPPWLAEPGGA